MKVKQVLIIRKDLKMRRGKECSQIAHASLSFLREKILPSLENIKIILSEAEKQWFKGNFAKITVQVSSEEELLLIHKQASEIGLTSYLVQDDGLTEFGGIPTYTACAIGPDYEDLIDPITKNLRLY